MLLNYRLEVLILFCVTSLNFSSPEMLAVYFTLKEILRKVHFEEQYLAIQLSDI
jgi:hypothetical protein